VAQPLTDTPQPHPAHAVEWGFYAALVSFSLLMESVGGLPLLWSHNLFFCVRYPQSATWTQLKRSLFLLSPRAMGLATAVYMPWGYALFLMPGFA